MLDSSPLEALEREVLNSKANREELEDILLTLPRWRFRHRRAVQRSVLRRRQGEQRLQEAMDGTSSDVLR